MQKKIALIGDCLSGGGAEKVHATLSNYFKNQQMEVHNVIFVDSISYSYSGELLNLGKMKSVTTLDKLKRLHFLRKYMRQHNFDYIIDFRYRVNSINEFLLAKWVYSAPTFFTIHSGMIDYYMPNNNLIAKLIYSKSTIVTVSKAIENELKKRFNFSIQTIYNPFDFDKIETLSNEFIPNETNYIVAVGRMNERVKQYDKLIEAYSLSNLPTKNIKLLLLGEGKYLGELKQLVKEKNLTDKVVFKGNQNNPFPYIQNAVFLALSSKNEGLPNVLIESLATEIPVVSFDCFSGPNEIIINNENGLLVENQNVSKLSQAMNEMIENEVLYLNCKKNARKSITNFSIEQIGSQWMKLLTINTAKKI